MKNKPLTDESIAAICESELKSSSGSSESELSDERAEAMRRFNGELYGDEADGRSKVVTRDVLDTIETVMPSMMRLLTDAENLVTFEPVSEGDEEQAQQETDVVHHVFWEQNNGYELLYTLAKDGLLSKTGIIKAEWDDTREEKREEYQGVGTMDLLKLMQDPVWDREITEAEMLGPDSFNVTFETRKAEGRVRLTCYPPEDHGVSRDTRSTNVRDAPFSFVRGKMSRSDLIQAGYDKKKVEMIPTGDQANSEEEIARRNKEDEHALGSYGGTEYTDRVWITECFLHADRDGDGIDELLRVVLATGSSTLTAGHVLLKVEEVDSIMLSSWTPIPITHKYYGLSLADLVMDIQRIKTTILRRQLDNLQQLNTARTAGNQNVNQDDVVENQNGGHIRIRGQNPPQQSLMAFQMAPLPPETFQMHDYLDAMRQKRTGTGDEVGALDINALSNVNTGVATLMFDMARSKLEMYVRNLAEMCLKPLFRDIHELLQKHSTKAMTIRLRNKWVESNPSAWATREDIRVSVGLGRTNAERKMMALSDVMEKQAAVAQGGGLGMLVNPDGMYNAVNDYTELLGLNAERYWMDPAQAQPPEPQGPDPMMIAAQAQVMSAQAQQAKAMVDAKKAEIDGEMKRLEAETKRVELETRMQEAGIGLQIEQGKARMEEADRNDEAELKRLEAEAKAEIALRAEETKRIESLLRDDQEAAKRETDMQKAMLTAAVNLATPTGSEAVADVPGAFTALESMMADVQAQMVRIQENQNRPRTIQRDASGRVIAIDGRVVERDASGRMVQA